MPTMKEAASAFLANKRIAVTGVSRKPKEHGITFEPTANLGHKVIRVIYRSHFPKAV